MGVVYLARDARLDRPVAIKVLPEHLAADTERLARFEREARLLASLSHPNIAGIYGIEEADGQRLLVLEYVEGETLAARLARGPLPNREALQVCRQIAAAVEAAHENGVIHRDLKPGNVVITPDDEVKVLDFGLAKGVISTKSDSTPAESPTLTFQATSEGVILGTTAYLSPEQARGKTVNRRADIWAFGCILYECLIGRQAFEGETVSDTIAKILEREIDLSSLPEKTHPRVRELLQKCLEKDEKKRLRDIGDGRLELEQVLAAGDSSSTMRASDSWVRDVVPVSTRSNWARASVFTLVGIVIASAVWFLLGLSGSGSGNRHGEVTRFSVLMPEDLQVTGATLTADGQTMVLRASDRQSSDNKASIPRLYSRRMNDYGIEPIPGTEGVLGWVNDQDGRWIAFVAPLSERTTQKRLAKVPVDGSSQPVTIAEWSDEWGSTAWLHSGDFLIATGSSRSFVRLPAGGDAPDEPLPFLEGDTQYSFSFEYVLPGDRGVLLTAASWQEKGYQQSVFVLDLKSDEVKTLFDEGGEAKYSPTGHIVFSRGENLLAAPFDLGKLEVTGEPVAVLSGLRTNTIWANGSFELTSDGDLLYPPGGLVGGKRTVAIVEPSGEMRSLSEETYPFEGFPTVSADGRVFASVVSNANGIYEAWGGELARPRFRKLSAEPQADTDSPVLSPDGRWLAYQLYGRSPADGVYIRRVDGSGSPIKIVEPDSLTDTYWPTGWSPDGKRLLVNRASKGNQDLLLYDVPAKESTSASPARELFTSSDEEFYAEFSPDGRRIAFESDETGQHEVYVCTISPDGSVGLPVSVSNGEGHRPIWSRDGKRLYFILTQKGLLAVDISYQPEFSYSEPKVILDREIQELFGTRFQALPGGRLLVVRRGDQEGEVKSYNIVLNWAEELKQKTSAQVAVR
jgi:serine/threonine-protein kinase